MLLWSDECVCLLLSKSTFYIILVFVMQLIFCNARQNVVR